LVVKGDENMKKYNLIEIMKELGYTERGAKMVISRNRNKFEIDMDKNYTSVTEENVKEILNCLKKPNILSTFEKIEEFSSDNSELEKSTDETSQDTKEEIEDSQETTEISNDSEPVNKEEVSNNGDSNLLEQVRKVKKENKFSTKMFRDMKKKKSRKGYASHVR
jgi:hypothetical protein